MGSLWRESKLTLWKLTQVHFGRRRALSFVVIGSCSSQRVRVCALLSGFRTVAACMCVCVSLCSRVCSLHVHNNKSK